VFAPELFILADRTLDNVVQQIADDQWQLPIPAWLATGRANRDGLDLRTLINYHAYDDSWVPDMLAGRTMADVGADKWKEQDLLGDTPKVRFHAIVETAVAAAATVTPEQLHNVAHLSFGDFPIEHYLAQITSFRAFRAYEFAALIGVDPTLPDDLVRGVWDQLQPHIDEWRAIGVYGPAVEVPDDASPQDRLLALTGRQPRG
jgi:uncharacterized protein (TIGR03086 family)